MTPATTLDYVLSQKSRVLLAPSQWKVCHNVSHVVMETSPFPSFILFFVDRYLVGLFRGLRYCSQNE